MLYIHIRVVWHPYLTYVNCQLLFYLNKESQSLTERQTNNTWRSRYKWLRQEQQRKKKILLKLK